MNIGFILKTSFITLKIDILSQIDRFSPYFFGKSGQGGLIMNDLCSSSLNINVLVGNVHFLLLGHES